MAITQIVLESEKDTIEVRKALQSLADEIRGAGGSTNNITNAAREVRMILSNNSGAPNTTIDIAAGQVYAQDNKSLIVNDSTIQATLSSPANNTWYRVFILGGSGVTAQGTITTSATPTLPAGYTLYRRIGWIHTDGSGNIFAFVQNGQYFVWKAAKVDRAGGAVPTSRTLQTMTAPPNTICQFYIRNATAGGAVRAWVKPTFFTDAAASDSNLTVICVGSQNMSYDEVQLDNSSQLAYRSDSTNLQIWLQTSGWIDQEI